MVVLDFSMIPIGQGESVSPFVARMVDIVDRSGLDYRCHAMGTTIEGDLEQVFGVVKDCFQATGRRLQPHRLHDQTGLP